MIIWLENLVFTLIRIYFLCMCLSHLIGKNLWIGPLSHLFSTHGGGPTSSNKVLRPEILLFFNHSLVLDRVSLALLPESCYLLLFPNNYHHLYRSGDLYISHSCIAPSMHYNFMYLALQNAKDKPSKTSTSENKRVFPVATHTWAQSPQASNSLPTTGTRSEESLRLIYLMKQIPKKS